MNLSIFINEIISLINGVINIIIGAIITGISAWIIFKRKQKYHFMEKQLRDFYAPLYSLKMQMDSIKNEDLSDDERKNFIRYLQMEIRNLFLRSISLADPRSLKFLEILMKCNEGKIVNHPKFIEKTEKELKPFYEHIEHIVESLINNLAIKSWIDKF